MGAAGCVGAAVSGVVAAFVSPAWPPAPPDGAAFSPG